MSKKTITIERRYQASVEDVWELWATKEGIESWWGPEGFTVTVSTLDLRSGGTMEGAMTATGAEQIAFMKSIGMPLSSALHLKYTEVVAQKRIAYTTLADFIPGVDPYDVGTAVDFYATEGGVRMVITVDAMHDEVWTQRMVAGKEGELVKLERILAARAR